MADLIQPKEIEIETQSGEKKTFIFSKFPAIAGREIVSKYPVSNLPKLGDYAVSEAIMLKLMSYVAVKIGDQQIRLDTRALYENHVPDWETGAKIEIGMMEYNCSFFGNGAALSFFQGIAQKAQAMISSILTDLSAQSSPQTKQNSTNSEQSTV